MNQQIGFHLLGRAKCQFDVGAMHRIARLKCNHTTPAKAGELCSQLCWSEPQGPEIVMSARLNAFYPASHIPWMRLVEQIIDAGMGMARPSASRNAILLLPGFRDLANCSGISSVIGIGHNTPLARRILWHTPS